MATTNYVLYEQRVSAEVRLVMKVAHLARKLRIWRRNALVAYGLFMVSVVANLVLIFGR